jgi:hypothetical protein
MHWVISVMQTEMHTSKLLVPEFSPFIVVIAVDKQKEYKLQGIKFWQN